MVNMIFEIPITRGGAAEELTIKVPVEEGTAFTDRFRPAEFKQGGEYEQPYRMTLQDLAYFCFMQAKGMEMNEDNASLLDIHIEGLMASVMNCLDEYERLYFSALFIFMDYFSLLLEADGFAEEEIRKMYPRILRTIVDLYPDRIIVEADKVPFKESPLDAVLNQLCEQSED